MTLRPAKIGITRIGLQRWFWIVNCATMGVRGQAQPRFPRMGSNADTA
jgi:hypothetical protein